MEMEGFARSFSQQNKIQTPRNKPAAKRFATKTTCQRWT
jgi:hypothetical protein